MIHTHARPPLLPPHCVTGLRPVVVLTHVDEFEQDEVEYAKSLAKAVTGVPVNRIIGIACYTQNNHKHHAETDAAALQVVVEALTNAEATYPPVR